MHALRFWQAMTLILMITLLTGCSSPTAAPTVAPAAATAEPALPTQTAASNTPQITDAGRIQFQPNTTSWYTQGDVAPNGAIHFVLSALKGQQMNIWLTTEPASTDGSLAYLYLTDASGQSLLISPEMYFSAVLDASQDYTIEVRSAGNEPVIYTLVVNIPAKVIDPALGMMYDLPDLSVCQSIQQAAAEALGVDFSIEGRAPFLDEVAGEAGQGCRLSARGNGTLFADPQSVVRELVGSAGLGWTEQPAYQADGPTGSTTALARDMGLMIITANWAPDMGVVCPADQPISDCNLTPEQKITTVQINIAQYRADFSMDGNWQDADGNFTLDLFQDWKNIYGHHSVVAQNGAKIDALDVSIDGSLQGKVATVQFKSSFTDGVGTAQITYVDVNTITWKIITPPDGEFYLPAEATLTRK